MADENKYAKAAKARASSIRLRTWTLTAAIIICLAFYLLVSVTTKQTINWFDFILLCIMQIVIYCVYFPDGDLYGQKDPTFIANKQSYNDKANEITQNKQMAALRTYCKHEYEQRKKSYILNQCGIIGITVNEFALLKQLPEKEIKKIESFKVMELNELGEEKEKIIVFSKQKRKMLYKLIFKPLPVEENFPETIMSAIENKGNKAIKDGSISYKSRSYISKFFRAVVIGSIFAYIGYTAKDGFGIAEILSMFMYITTLLTSAVMAYSAGENCSKIYKSRFYLELANFIDGFQEWITQENSLKKEITKEPEVKLVEEVLQEEPIEEPSTEEIDTIEEENQGEN